MAKIAINTRFLLPDKLEGFGWFTHEVVQRMVVNHPEHEFFFFFDRSFDKKFIYAPNVTPVVISPPARDPILFYIWFEIGVKKALKKNNIDLFFSPDGYLSLSSSVPQIAVIHDLNFEHYPKDLPLRARKYLRKYFPKFAKHARHIITVSEYSKSDIQKTYSIDASKITVAHNGVNPMYQPIDSEQKTKIQNSITGGIPYFLYVGSLHPRKNIIRLLQAWDIYRDHGGKHAMVIAGSAYWWNKEMNTAFAALRHGKEVIFTGHLPIEKLTGITAAADVLTYVSYFEGFGIPVAEAMRCGVPVLAANTTSLPEVAGDAAIYCDPFSVADIAQKMAHIASNPELKEKLGKAGIIQANRYKWENTTDKTWQVLENELNQKI
jgi:glycosyltransferase involved in cell wall biosynthesis